MGTALEINHVWKKFNRGEFNDSLRDAVPAAIKSIFGFGPKQSELAKNEFWALKDVDFKVEEGESVALIGHNGAGKSTLLKILSKIYKPNLGNIKSYGRMRSLIEIGSGFVGDLTGRENIYLNGAFLGMSQKEIASKFDAIVDFSGIEEFLDMPLKRYSSGMAARLGFAVAAHLEPEILIVDEVLAVGDLAFQKKCLGKMSDVANSGRTVVFVSHSMTAVRKLCPRAILFNHGEVVDDGLSENVIQHYFNLLKEEQHSWEEITRKANPDPSAEITNVLAGRSLTELSENPLGYTAEPFYVRVYYNIYKPIENATITVVFVNFEARYVMPISTRLTTKAIGTLKKTGYIDFYIPTLGLGRGIYTLVAQIHDLGTDTKERHCYSQIIDALTLNVMSVNTKQWLLEDKYFVHPIFSSYDWEIHDN